jgi:hypothetical protein
MTGGLVTPAARAQFEKQLAALEAAAGEAYAANPGRPLPAVDAGHLRRLLPGDAAREEPAA